MTNEEEILTFGQIVRRVMDGLRKRDEQAKEKEYMRQIEDWRRLVRGAS